MIGFAYLARGKPSPKTLPLLWCVKRMLGQIIAQKGLFPAVRRELKILSLVRGVSGCVQLVDVIADETSLGLVVPYYPAGDLAAFIKNVFPNNRRLPEKIAKPLFTQLV